MAEYISFYKDEQVMFRHLREEIITPSHFFYHMHEQMEILFLVQGTVSYVAETTSYPLIPDALIITRPMESHMIEIHGNEPYERYTLNFPSEAVDAIDPERRLLAPFFDRKLGEKNLYLASEFTVHPKRLFEAMEQDRGDRRLVLNCNIYALLDQLCAAFEKKKHETQVIRKSLATETADYINLHLFDDISVQSVADTMSVSVSQLNRQFKKTTGFAIWEYVVNKRLIAARNLIKSGTPATHAFSDCGFNDYSSFYRMYMKKFGVSPKDDIAKK